MALRRRNLIVWIFLLSAAAPLGAERASDQIKNKTRDLNKVKEELSKKRVEREKLQKEAEDLSEKMKENQSKMKNVEQVLYYNRQKNAQMGQEVATTKIERDRLLTFSEKTTGDVKKSYQTYYLASAVYCPTSFAPVYTHQLLRSQVRNLNTVQNEAENANENLLELMDTQYALRKEVERQEQNYESLRSGLSEKERLLSKKKTRQQILEAELKELEQTAEQMSSLIEVLRSRVKEEAQAEKKARLEKQVSGHSPIPRHSLPWPMKGTIGVNYGRQQHPTLGTTYISNGIVIDTKQNQPLLAVADGRVLYVGEFMSYGSMVLLEHPGDWYTVYGRLLKWTVEKGQEIKKGEELGWPRPGGGTGKEAYFELRFYGKPTNPLPWLSEN